MLRRAVETVASVEKNAPEPPKLLGVTILTSMDEEQISGVGLNAPIERLVIRLAHLADTCGLDGIVCSPQELGRLGGETFKRIFYVTPGIRPKGAQQDDQARTNTAAGAIGSGARHLVIGRPITQAHDPARAAEAFVEEIRRAKIGTE